MRFDTINLIWYYLYNMKQKISKKKVLFVCIYNSVRSQLAEGILRGLYDSHYEVYSAGIYDSGINPCAIKVMKEIGIDISRQYSKSLKKFEGLEFDFVVTLCDEAKQACPFFPGGKKYLHKSFRDPAQFKGSQDRVLNVFRLIRDEIKDWIKETFSPVRTNR